MRKEDYWVVFSKSGKIEDYLSYKAVEADNTEDSDNASEHKRTDTKGTEYR
jgi:hypothetical protein